MTANIPLGKNINFNPLYTQALWGDRGVDDFWFYQETSNQWYYYNIAEQEFFLVQGEPRNIHNLKVISLQTFQNVREFIYKKNRQVMSDIPIWPENKPLEIDPWSHIGWR